MNGTLPPGTDLQSNDGRFLSAVQESIVAGGQVCAPTTNLSKQLLNTNGSFGESLKTHNLILPNQAAHKAADTKRDFPAENQDSNSNLSLCWAGGFEIRLESRFLC